VLELVDVADVLGEAERAEQPRRTIERLGTEGIDVGVVV
jgi:hypothetical protein